MNLVMPTHFLRVTDSLFNDDGPVVLGRDIHTRSEMISNYCVTRHAPVYEDLATLVESMAYCDRFVPRRRVHGWSRDLTIEIPVYELGCFMRSDVGTALTDAAWFLTGDRWHFQFVARRGPAPGRQGHLNIPLEAIAHVIPFSNGLDSFAQAQLSKDAHGRDAVMLVRSGLGHEHSLEGHTLRVPRRFSGAHFREMTYRTRPLVFFTMAAIGAAIAGAGRVVIGESGQGAIGPACLPFADEWWFRSAHPGFIRRWAAFLSLVLGVTLRFDQPQLWRTKGEVLSELKQKGLTDGWERTTSCATRPNNRHGRHACGVCGGCVLRTVAAHKANLPVCEGDVAFNLMGAEAIARDRRGGMHPMTAGERAVAVRAISVMANFAKLAEAPDRVIVLREAELIDPANSHTASQNLIHLLSQHRDEWLYFLDRLPERSWVAEIVSQL